MRNFAERVLKPYGLTLEQFHLLKNMSLVDGLTQRQICNLTSKTPANMSRMLDRMESKSLVARRENPVDRRASLVFLTTKGESLVDEVVEEFESFSSKLTRGINEREQQVVRDALTKIARNTQQMSEELDK
jgi:DNA-binding MarR family transcriptional regulator